ncbi:LysM peptidoglycan-binding domain-containing protein [Chromobacterium vaccinii]|uniref:LysM peptidoglycan-binding domain-containing protein n=1 Tax=Chromobacterium vaccinii TaxID=1108595 RepID=UPI001184B7A1|nr:LysM peptidoglycan-binding domain-containing protein [Chromobacterium vaccinii]
MTYDAFGNKASYTNQLGAVFSYDYDAAGHVLKETGRDGATVLSVKRFEYDAFGNRTLQVEAEGQPEQRRTSYGYDANNRLISQTGDAVKIYTLDKGEATLSPTETRRYDAAGNLVEFIDAGGNVTRSAYDSQNRKVRERNGDGYVTTWAYDGAGNVIEQRVYAAAVGLSADGSTPQPADGNCRVTKFEYDNNNRLKRTIVPNQTVGMRDAGDGKYKIKAQDLVVVKQYDANGNVAKETDARGNSVYRYYDKAGRKLLEVDAAGYAVAWDYNSAGKPIRETHYAAAVGVPADGDTLDMVRAKLKPNAGDDRISEFDYDRMGRVAEERRLNAQLSADDGVSDARGVVRTQYHYNQMGLVDQKTDAKNGVTDIGYDKLGHETHREDAAFANQIGQMVRPTTDSYYNGLGQLVRSVKAGVAGDFSKMTYGAGGRLLSQVDAEQNITYYEYDAAGNITRTQHPRQQAAGQPLLQDLVSYQYNAAKQQIAKLDASTGIWSETHYNAWGQISGKRTSVNRQGDWQEFSEYDGAGRLVKGNAGGVTKLYGYDANGNATLTVESGGIGGDELRGMSLDQVMELVAKRIDHQAPMDNLRLTVTDYDARNKQVATYQPLMTNARQQSSVQVERWISVKPQVNNGAVVTMGPIGKPLPPDSNPLSAGILTRVANPPQSWPFTGSYNVYGIEGLPDNTAKVLFFSGVARIPTLKTAEAWSDCEEILPNQSPFGRFVLKNGIDGFGMSPGVGEFLYVALDSNGNPIVSSHGVLRQAQAGFKQFDQTSRGGHSAYSFYKYATVSVPIPNYGGISIGNKLPDPGPDSVYFGFGEPAGGARIRFRTSDSAWGDYQSVAMSEFRGVYKFSMDKISLPAGGDYQYQIDSLNDNGSVKNTYVGELSPGGRVFTQPCLLKNSIQQLHFLEPTGQALSGVIHYRLKGAENYTTSSLLRDERGGFYWNAAGELLLPMGDPAHYEYQYELLSDQGRPVSVGAGEVTLSIPVSSVPLPRDPRAESVDFSYRKLGDNGPFVKGWATRVWLGPSGASFQSDVVSKYEYQYEAFTDSTNYLKYPLVISRTSYGTYSGIATFGGENRIIRNDSLPLPLSVTFSTDRKDAAQLSLSYRTKGSNAEWKQITLPGTAQSGFLFNVDSLAVDDYEYSYQLRDSSGSVLRDADGGVINMSGYLHRGGAQEETSADNLHWVLLGVSDKEASVARRQHYNAFGEVDSETDGEQNTTRYSYSTAGKLLSKQDPLVSVTLENGQKQTASPLTQYRYDAMGNTVAVIDANGHQNRQRWLAGSQDGQGKVSDEWHADGGDKQTGSHKAMSYDALGNLRSSSDELSRTTSYSYDRLGHLKRINRAGGGYDEYDYDSAGQRIAHRTTSTGSDVLQDTTSYDSLGRVLETISAAQRHTRYSYQWDASLLGAGGTVVGGWRTVTTNANNQTQQDAVNLFGLKVAHVDLGNHSFTYQYNAAGQISSQSGSTGQNIVYRYYGNGYLKSLEDSATNSNTLYEYDKDGRKIFEGYTTLSNQSPRVFQYADITYDELGRVTQIKDAKFLTRYEYDAVGNRRRVYAEYSDGVNGSKQVQDNWYRYDQMNRFTISMGKLENGQITRGGVGSDGVEVQYDVAGQRRVVINAKDGTSEKYSYTDNGFLTDVTINDKSAARRVNDLLGRTAEYTSYRWDGDGGQNSKTTTTYDADNKIKHQVVDDATTDYDLMADGTVKTTTQVSKGTTTTTYYGYEWWDEAKQSTITAQPYNKDAPGWRSGISHLTYDVNGHLKMAIDEEKHRSLSYINNAQGLVLQRDESSDSGVFKSQSYYYLDGKQVGAVGNDGPARVDYAKQLAQIGLGNKKDQYRFGVAVSSADFDQNYEPIGPNYPGQTPGSVTVREGDTLQVIAANLWGDRSLWYLLADANGLQGTEALKAGQVLRVPNKVTNFHNNSGTYRVYSPGEAIGDVTPTLPEPPPPPPPPGGGCGGFGMVLVAIVAVVATVVTAGAAAAALGPVLAGALGGAVGSIAGQAMAMTLGMQSKFSWSQVGVGAIGGAVTGGMQAGAFGQALNNSNIVVQGMASSVISQGVSMAVGLQKSFSWTSVAASGVAAWAANSVGLQAGKGTDAFERIGYGTMRGMLNGTIQSVIGEDHRPDWGNLAANSFGSAVGDQVAGSLRAAEQERLNKAGREVNAIRGMYANTQKAMLNSLMGFGSAPSAVSTSADGAFSYSLDDGGAGAGMEWAQRGQAAKSTSLTSPELYAGNMHMGSHYVGERNNVPQFVADPVTVTASSRGESLEHQRMVELEDLLDPLYAGQPEQNIEIVGGRNMSAPVDIMGQPLNGRSNYSMSLGWSKVMSGEVGLWDFLTYTVPDADAINRELNAKWAPSPLEQRLDMISSSPAAAAGYLGALAFNGSQNAQDTAMALGYYGGNALSSMASVKVDATQYGLLGASRPLNGVERGQESGLRVGSRDTFSIVKGGLNNGPLLQEPGTVEYLLYGARIGVGLPGSSGIVMSRRPTVEQMINLSEKHGVEFATVYTLGPGKNGRGGYYSLYSGGPSSVSVGAFGADKILINHTHPQGTASASGYWFDRVRNLEVYSPDSALVNSGVLELRGDQGVLQGFINAGSPQRSSVVIPGARLDGTIMPPFRFDVNSKNLDYTVVGGIAVPKKR